MLAVCTASAFAQKIDTKNYVTHFFKLSQNDFEIDSRSKSLNEQKSYVEFKNADIEGGSPDGKITYSEYLTYSNKITPDSIAPFDFAVSKLLPYLKDFNFADNGDFFASGISAQSITIGFGQVIPAGAKISLFKWGGLRVNPIQDFYCGAISVRGGENRVVDMGLSWNTFQFSFASFQLLKDVVIGDIPCKALPVDPWDINIELNAGNGEVRRAILSEAFHHGNLLFNAGERIQLGWDGAQVEAALITSSRNMQGKTVVAYYSGLPDQAERGLWGGNRPNIYFENNLIKMCYEENKVLDGRVIDGIHQYHYAGTGQVIGITPESSYFLGYPVALDKFQGGWDWTIPKPLVAVAYLNETMSATFKIENEIQLSGKTGKLNAPAGSELTIDIRTGHCLSVKFPEGKILAYNASRDQMAPVQLSLKEQPKQVRIWMETWLAAHPEAADGSNKDLRLAHTQVRDQALVQEKKIAQDQFFMKLLESVLLYKDKAKGLAAGNVALDVNGDGKIQDLEHVPESMLEPGKRVFPADKLFAFFVEKAATLPINKLKLLGLAMATLPISSATDDFGTIDKLGSILSKAGIHPFTAKKIYYFPNGSGDKVHCRNIEFYPSGMPKKIKLEVPQEVLQKDITPLMVSIPSQTEKLYIWLYSYEHLEKNNPGNKQTNGYWHDANEVEFWESGSLSRIGNFAFTELFLPVEYGALRNPAGANNILWTKEGQVYQLVQAGDGNTYTLSDTMSIGYFYSITWMNIPQCRVAIGLENAIAVDLFFKKGQYTLYNEDPKTKQLIPYTKVFDKDTMVKVIGGFWVDAKGQITRYWGEKK